MDKKLVYPVIWGIVQSIPKGSVASYGQLAKLTGLQINPRQVAYALKIAPKSLNLPWHRVINSAGRISFLEKSESFRIQKELLLSEAVCVDGNKVNLKKFQWES